MSKKVNELLTAQTTSEYFEVCTSIARELEEEYSAIAANVFYQLHNNGLIDIVFDGDINFIIEGINKSVEDISNLLKWTDSDLIKITKNNSKDIIIVKVVL